MTFLYEYSIFKELEASLSNAGKGIFKNAQQSNPSLVVNELIDNLKTKLISGDKLGSRSELPQEKRNQLSGQIYYKDIVSFESFLDYCYWNMVKFNNYPLVIDLDEGEQKGVRRDEDEILQLIRGQRDFYSTYKNKYLVYTSGIKQYLSNLYNSINDAMIKNQVSKLIAETSTQLKLDISSILPNSSGQVPGKSQSGGAAGTNSAQQGASSTSGTSPAPGQSGTMGASQGPAFGNQQQTSQSQNNKLANELVSSLPFQSTEEFDVYACVKFADNFKRLVLNNADANSDMTQYYAQMEQMINSLRQFVAAWQGRVGDVGLIQYNLSGKLPTLSEIVSGLIKLPKDASGPNFKAALKDALGLLKDIVNSTINLLTLLKKIRKLQPFIETVDNNIGVGKRYFNDIQAQISRV